MSTFQTQLLNELGEGPDGEPISQSKLIYLQERLRGRFFDFLVHKFDDARCDGLNQAKLARRIRKSPEVVNRWLSAPTNLTLDSISDLFAGIAADELEFTSSSLLGRARVNYFHLDDVPSIEEPEAPKQTSRGASAEETEASKRLPKAASALDSIGVPLEQPGPG